MRYERDYYTNQKYNQFGKDIIDAINEIDHLKKDGIFKVINGDILSIDSVILQRHVSAEALTIVKRQYTTILSTEEVFWKLFNQIM